MKCIILLQLFLTSIPYLKTKAWGSTVSFIYPSNGFVKEGEFFELQCELTAKTFFWYKDDKLLPGFTNKRYKTKANMRSGGSYSCKTKSAPSWWMRNKQLDVVTIATDPILTLDAKPRGALSGKPITLTCSLPHIEKIYPRNIQWFRNDRKLRETGQVKYISRSKISDEGTYRCELRHHFRKWISTNVDITVTDGDVAFQVDPITVFEGELLNLTCRYRRLLNWQHATFYQDKRSVHSILLVHSEILLTTKANGSKGTASYHCTVGSRESRHVVVLIHERFSKPTLRAEPGTEIFEGQQLRVMCFVEKSHSSNSLKYAFYHNGEDLNFTSAEDLTLTEAASFKDSGVFFCEVNDLAHGLKKKSDDIHISVREAFSTPTLEAESEDQLFEGQQLKIICLVETNPSNSYLGYLFSKNGQTLHSTPQVNYYIKETVRLEDSGTYQCEAMAMDSMVTKLSNHVSVKIKAIPVAKPQFTIYPGIDLMEGDTARLNCSVSSGSFPITYRFYNGFNSEIYQDISNDTNIMYEIDEVSTYNDGFYYCTVANEATKLPLESGWISFEVIVPVVDASLLYKDNITVVLVGHRLVLQCRVKAGTLPHFVWFRNNQPLENSSETYQLNADGSEFIINSLQTGDEGRYHCVAINKGINETVFNATSNHIEVAMPVRSYTSEVTASVLPLLLIAGVIALITFKLRDRKPDNSSGILQTQGGTTEVKSEDPSQEPSSTNLEYAVIGSVPNTQDTETATDLVYSTVTIQKSNKSGNAGGSSGSKKVTSDETNDYCITYATLNHRKDAENLEGVEMEEGIGSDSNVYENIPRK